MKLDLPGKRESAVPDNAGVGRERLPAEVRNDSRGAGFGPT
jgi:hypothetical protein